MMVWTAGSVLLTLLKVLSGSVVVDDSVNSIHSKTLTMGYNEHALSTLTAAVHCAFSLVFTHFCDHNMNSPLTTAGMYKNAAGLVLRVKL